MSHDTNENKMNKQISICHGKMEHDMEYAKKCPICIESLEVFNKAKEDGKLPTPPSEVSTEDWEKRFDKDFAVYYPGDTGFGGNDPQEPLNEIMGTATELKDFIRKIREEAKRDEQERINKAIVNHFNNTEVFYGNPRKEKMIYYDDALEIINLISDNKN